MNKLRAFITGVILLSTIGMGGSALAANNFDLFDKTCEGNGSATVCRDSGRTQSETDNTLFGSNGIVSKIVSILSIIIGVAAVIVIIIAGIQYMVSTGDPTKVNNAKNAILYALVGLVVAVFAQVLVRFVINRL